MNLLGVRKWHKPVPVVRVCVSEIIPGRIHKCVHGVGLPPGRALASNRGGKKTQRVGRSGASVNISWTNQSERMSRVVGAQTNLCV